MWALLLSSSILGIAAAALIVLPTWSTFAYQGMSGGMDDYCYDMRTMPADVHPSPEAQFGGTNLGLFPFGVGCNWLLVDESWAFVPTNDPVPSILLYAGLGGVALAIVSSVHRPGDT
jgi:hypothetical protein